MSRALRLNLGASDVTPEGLATLRDFSNLKRCFYVRVGTLIRENWSAELLHTCDIAHRGVGRWQCNYRLTEMSVCFMVRLCMCTTCIILVHRPFTVVCMPIKGHVLHITLLVLLCCSLSVNAAPFDHAPQPVPLDLLDLPPGLTHLELRNIDVISQPADLTAAAAPYPSFATAPSAPQPPSFQPQQQAGLEACGSTGLGGSHSGSGCTSGGSSGGAGMERVSSCSSDGGGGMRGMLQHLESFKLESCRLRAAQLQVGVEPGDAQ